MRRHYRLDALCDIRSGGTPPRSSSANYGGNFPWAKIDDLNVENGVVSSTKECITEIGLQSIRGRLVEPGTLLFAMYGSVGKMAWAGVRLATNQAILGISVLDPQKLAPSYLKHWLASKQADFDRDANGVTQKNLSAGYVRDLEIALPPIEEQQRIATILDKADGLRRKRQEAIRLADELLRAAYLEVAQRNPVRAPVESLLAEVPNAARTGPFGSQLLVSEFSASGIPVLGIDNVVSNTFTWAAPRYISHEKYAELDRYTVRPGDVMVTIMGTTGRVAIAPDDLPTCISTKHLCTLTLDRKKMLPTYLWACLRWDPEVKAQTRREAKGAIMEGWNMGIVKGLLVNAPPMDVQLKFEEIAGRIKRMSSAQALAAKGTDELMASLSAKYLEPTT
ncbi:Restriction modification system DNA specificity domain protein [Methyloversatilis universalis FAM5]|uniref:Restriction modification system DNA specificity domain protein n=1 Tax=Methyloversatilis universalis (strain ATCC BAA-1314 / DSM 25237 / JCM 13912 / CCUG 52030 / FAM5) TaxID=1000565 RepID=F5RCG8_METUF|nr:restriction endonuclease subunit S [Methyloversatilis universalis]EGK71734.1 Restriction modification system DNA specificity domain protein [Methyloversatilis universalis FAM5]